MTLLNTYCTYLFYYPKLVFSTKKHEALWERSMFLLKAITGYYWLHSIDIFTYIN